MASAKEIVNIVVDGAVEMQKIDGFGVNINSKYWEGGGLKPVIDLLLDDLGATLFRVDIYGKSNWVDPDDKLGAGPALNADTYARVYTSPVFRDGWGMMKYLNARGIKPYLTASGIVPKWMCRADGRTLGQYGQFCDMMVSLLDWARRREGIDFNLFGPLNETDLGPVEGPAVSPEEYVKIVALLDEKLRLNRLDDVRLVYAEQSGFNANYLSALAAREELASRIGPFGMHCYYDHTPDDYQKICESVGGKAYAGHSLWLTEYGDLDQSGEREWYVAWVSTKRLLTALANGFSGAMAWDAYDNYHDHDEAWTIYGLIRNARRTYTPKKRYYAARQVYRFVPPGFVRVGLRCEGKPLNALAFADGERRIFTIVGMNDSTEALYLNVKLNAFAQDAYGCAAEHYRTTEEDNCVLSDTVRAAPHNWPFDGYAVQIEPNSIFTLTNIARG